MFIMKHLDTETVYIQRQQLVEMPLGTDKKKSVKKGRKDIYGFSLMKLIWSFIRLILYLNLLELLFGMPSNVTMAIQKRDTCM